MTISPNPTDIRLIVLDLDGTSVGKSNQIRPMVRQAIQAAQAQGVQVAIATGRMYQSARRFHTDLGLTLPISAYQGALIQDPATEQVHRHWTLPQAAALALLDYFEQPDWLPELSVNAYIGDRLYVREITPSIEAYVQRTQVPATAVGDLRQVLTQHEPTKLLAHSPNPALIDQLMAALRPLYPPEQLYFTKSVPTFFEATHPAVNKGEATRYLAEELLGVGPEQVMAVGDNFNDLEMITYAGVGVAMGDAPDAVKAAANWVAPTVEEDGVAVAIGRFVVGK